LITRPTYLINLDREPGFQICLQKFLFFPAAEKSKNFGQKESSATSVPRVQGQDRSTTEATTISAKIISHPYQNPATYHHRCRRSF
jgi:hypothetical protein